MKEFVFSISERSVLEILLIGALLFLGLRLAQKGLIVYTRNKQVNPVITRLFPIFEFSAWILFAVWGAKQVFQTETGGSIILLALMAAILTWAGSFVVRDWIAGVVFKAEDRYRPDDIVSFNNTHGRLKHLGYRSLIIETPDGGTVEIPYSAMVGKSTIKKTSGENPSCSFIISVPSMESFKKIQHQLQITALCAPWCTIRRKPRIRIMERGENHYTVEVTAFVIDQAYGPDVEAYVKQHFILN